MFEYHFIARPDLNPSLGYPIAIGRIFEEPAHLTQGTRYPQHQYNIHFVVKGSGWLKTPTETIALEPGSGFLYSGDQAQHFGSDTHCPWEVWWIMFSGEGLRDLLGDRCLDDAWVFSLADNKRILPLVTDIWELAEQQSLPLVPRMASLLYEIILELLLHCSSFRAPKKRSLEDSIRHAAEYMRFHSGKKLTLQHLADFCGISPYYFSRTFHQVMGVPPLEYLNVQRIQLAKQMLLATTKLVKQVALEVGFKNSSYFIERFRKQEGITPAEFRERLVVSEK
ncbi:helix-turn-helix transcriptional regulator [Paenibacillus eucommiae]|uniref:AraC-like DNA-binding protein n=1 Tax=Paenibacillus eucommiae TaxID=1355755 RepID=A0ABS4IRI1_9BACL|nr:AraC family transcriptional regulator [Paenibacillus eucommiae]MBP1990183.1 AraC-like DNA-binding protein [Paenibacillus eucommiae]